MNALKLFFALGLLLNLAALRAPAAQPFAPVTADSLQVPDSLGVNIHFTDPRPGEMEMLAAAGFKWIRMDLSWERTEPEKGRYDFSPFDRLLEALRPHGIRAVLILDYANRHYDGGLSPHTDEGRRAFARWAAAAAVHFKNRGVLWEMYNEPNIKFWKPEPDVKVYIPLALAVGKALREAAPGEQYVGPATSRIDFKFLEPCFQAGLLEYWSAVSVHPYREKEPETVIPEYAKLRRMIDHYAPQGKRIPILSGEWGYTAIGKRTPEIQGKYLARQFLTNLMAGVPVSIWYDWHDDGTDPKEGEHHFGTVSHPYHEGQTPVYDPKPAYLAARALTSNLHGCRFEKRLAAGGPRDYVLLFSAKSPSQRVIAAWTTDTQAHPVTLPGLTGNWRVIDHLGQAQPPLNAGAEGLTLTLSNGPQYLIPLEDKKVEASPMTSTLPCGAFVAPLADWRKYYHGPVWEKVFTALEKLPADAPDGETKIQGEDIILRVSSTQTKPAGEAKIEAHCNYIDVQMVLAGQETMRWFPLAGLTVSQDYDPVKDVMFFDNKVAPLGQCQGRPGIFAVFTPRDAHTSGIFAEGTSTPQRSHKAVIKVDVELLKAGE